VAKNIQIISANGRPVRVGAQVAPADGTPITVDLDDVTVVRHLDSRRGEWLQLDDVASGGGGGGGGFADKMLVGRWNADTLPGVLNQVHTILPDGSNLDITQPNAHRGCFQLSEDEIAGTLPGSQKLQFYVAAKATTTTTAIVSTPTGVLKAGVARVSGDLWASNGSFTVSTPLVVADLNVNNTINVDFTADAGDALFVTDATADGSWFAPVYYVSSGTPNAATLGFGVEIALYAKIETV